MLASYGSEPHILPRSGEPHATRSTNSFRNPAPLARVSAPARSSSDLPHAGGVCARPGRLSSGRKIQPLPVAGPSASPIADARRPAAPPRTEGLLFSTTAPRVGAAAPVPESLAELLLDFPWAKNITRSLKCHYIIQLSIRRYLEIEMNAQHAGSL